MDDAAPAWRSPALLGAGAMAAILLLVVVNPNTTHVPLCPLKALTGLDCPFCGSLRAVHSLAFLRPMEAASHNLLFTVAAPVLVVGWMIWMRRSLHGSEAPPRLPRAASMLLLALAAGFFVARNVAALAWLGSSA